MTLFLLKKAMTKSGHLHCPDPGLPPDGCGCCPTSGLAGVPYRAEPGRAPPSWSCPGTPVMSDTTGRSAIFPSHPAISWDSLLGHLSRSGSPSENPASAPSSSWGKGLETQMTKPHPRTTESENVGAGPSNLHCSKPFRKFPSGLETQL